MGVSSQPMVVMEGFLSCLTPTPPMHGETPSDCQPAPAPAEPSHSKRIGSLNESSLHAAIKDWYVRPGDAVEAEVEGFIIDILRGDLLIEIQTSGFASIRTKLRKLVKNHALLLVHPIAREKWIVRLSPAGDEVLGRRKSPKRGRVIDLFDELVAMPDLINEPNVAIQVLMTKEEELRCPDGKGSWRRGGVSIVDRRLIEVCEKTTLSSSRDLAALLPDDLPRPFSNRHLAQELHIPLRRAQRATYCLRRAGAIKVVGKDGRALLFERVAPESDDVAYRRSPP